MAILRSISQAQTAYSEFPLIKKLMEKDRVRAKKVIAAHNKKIVIKIKKSTT